MSEFEKEHIPKAEITAQSRSQYFELSKHTSIQYVVYAVLNIAIVALLHIMIAMPLMDMFFTKFMHADVASSGEILEYRIAEGAPKDEVVTNRFTNWGVIERMAGAENELGRKRLARYLFNPTLALLPLVLLQ